MPRYERLADASTITIMGGGMVAFGAFVVEELGFAAGDQTPAILSWAEVGGGVIAGLGILGLAAYKILNPSPDQDDEHWRGY